MHTLTFASQVAYLDPLTGEGLLVMPHPHADVADPLGGRALHEVEWAAIMHELDGRGWEPSEDEDGGLCHVGYTRDGRQVIGLYGLNPVVTVPSMPEQARAFDELARAADLA